MPANVSVPINAELKVGALEETITVAAASPVVDVQNVSRTAGDDARHDGQHSERPEHPGDRIAGPRRPADDARGRRHATDRADLHDRARQLAGPHGGDDGRARDPHEPARRRDAELHGQPAHRGGDLQDERRRRRQLARRREPQHHPARTAATRSAATGTSAAATARGRATTSRRISRRAGCSRPTARAWRSSATTTGRSADLS